MAQATNTTVGQILCAGDLTGSGGAPTLVNTGVNAGSYTAVHTVHVDTKGRITWCNGTLALSEFSPWLYDATDSVRGLVQIGPKAAGYGLDVSSGSISFTPPDATKTSKGVMNAGTGINMNAGVASADFSALTPASKSSKGLLKVGSGIQANSGSISIDNEQLPVASTTLKGIAQAGNGFSAAAGVFSINYGQIAATTSTYGVMQVGSELAVDANGVVSADYTSFPAASATVKGLTNVGQNINVSTGVISVNTATDTVKGIFQIGDGIAQGTRATIYDPYDGTPGIIALDRFSFATPTVAGLVRAGWSTSVSGSGVMNLSPGWAATGWKGLVQIGTGLSVTNGNVTLNEPTRTAATDVNLGLVKINTANGLSITGDGTLNFSLGSFPIASTTTKGVVQVGSGLTIDGAGTLDIPIASTTTKGVLKTVSGSGIGGTGEISFGNANSTNPGVLYLRGGGVGGSTLSIAGDGTLSVDFSVGTLNSSYNLQSMDATKNNLTPSTLIQTGIAKVAEGDGLTISNGILSYDKRFATTTSKGIVHGDGTSIITGGGVAFVSSGTSAILQGRSYYSLRTKNWSIAPAAANNTVSQIALHEDVETTTFQISNANGTSYTLPSGTLTTNPPVGSIFKLIITQDATGGASITPSSVLGTTINTAANTITYIKYVVVGTNKAIPVEIYTGL